VRSADGHRAATVDSDVLYTVWKSWAEDNGHLPGAKSTFGRDLRAVVPELKQTQPRINGVQVRHYVGIALLPVSPVSDGETAGQEDDADTGAPKGDPCQPALDEPDTGHPVSDSTTNPQVNGTDTGDTGTTAFKAQTATPGGLTDRTPGMTDRVKLALANARSGIPADTACGVCGTELTRPESVTAGLCAECQLAAGAA
jgi:putative DNA primase/helicase